MVEAAAAVAAAAAATTAAAAIELCDAKCDLDAVVTFIAGGNC